MRAGLPGLAAYAWPATRCEQLKGGGKQRNLEIATAVLNGERGAPRDIVIANVAAILAQMGGDAVGSSRDGDLGRVHGVGMGAAARVSDRGDVIDIDP